MRKTILKVLILAFSFNFFLNHTMKLQSGVIENKPIDKEIIKISGEGKSFDLEMDLDNLETVLQLLKKYDYENAPKKRIVDGKIFYTYKRLENDPKKTIQELEYLIKNPEKYQKYEKFIKKAILSLLSNGIKIYIKELKKEISAEWIFKEKSIIFNYKSLEQGTKNFANLLSHEMIHIAQSCKGGSFVSYPVLLNLDHSKPKRFYYKYLKSKAYKNLKKSEKMLEVEAYANEKNHIQTLNLYKNFCFKN